MKQMELVLKEPTNITWDSLLTIISSVRTFVARSNYSSTNSDTLSYDPNLPFPLTQLVSLARLGFDQFFTCLQRKHATLADAQQLFHFITVTILSPTSIALV